jgi:hypothetical protein
MLGVLTLGDGAARAQSGDDIARRGFRLDYRGPPTCPAADEFRAQVRARSQLLRSEAGVPDEAVVATVTDLGGSFRGSLAIRSGDRLVGTREVEGASCKDVVAALALAAAIDLDAHPTPAASGQEPPVPEPTRPAVTPRSWRLGAGAHAGVTTGVADAALFGVSVFAEILATSHRLVAPSARLIFETTDSGTIDEAVGALRFWWILGALEACPLRWEAAWLRVAPCVRLEAGALQASPVGVPAGQQETRPWLAAGAVARAQWEPVSWAFLEIEGGLRVPFVREQFVVLPGVTVYNVPAAGLLAEAGAGIHFP